MDQRVITVVIFMSEKLQQKNTLSELAHRVNLSIWHLSHLFKAETGMTIGKYLKNMRMQEAKELLETTFLSVKEIMARVGINDKRHFAEDFKRIYGLTPRQYRKVKHTKLEGEITEIKQLAKSAT
jgi:transcriptional regulator GlxA family with amidase domain